MTSDQKSNSTKNRVYGRRKARPLRPQRKALLDTQLPQLQIQLTQGERLKVSSPCWLEIGFGGGEHLAALAQANPDVQLIGCEPFISGVTTLLKRIHKQNRKCS